MSSTPSRSSDCPNFLLSMLPEEEFATLRPHLELAETPLNFRFFEKGKPLQYAYFPCSGEHSVLAIMEDGRAAEVGTVGFEGFSTVDLLLGSDIASETTVCQVPGKSLRIPAARFRELISSEDELRRITLRYLQAYLAMVSQSVACNALHTLEQRFARWMLLTHDRVPGDEFRLTQEYIAMMLGTHRPRVSVVASAFQRDGMLQYRRGIVTILDRKALEGACCDCYGEVKKHFERFLGGYPMYHQ